MRQLFAQLDLDPFDLVFTLRPLRDTTTPAIAEAEENDQPQSPYAEITKFGPRFDELHGTKSTLTDTAEIRREFRTAAQPFTVENPKALLGSHRIPHFTPEVIGSAAPELVVALIQLTLQLEDVADDGALHDTIIDGRASAWTSRLAASK